MNGDEDCNLWKVKVKLNKEAERHPAIGILPCAESQSALVEPTHHGQYVINTGLLAAEHHALQTTDISEDNYQRFGSGRSNLRSIWRQ